MRNRNYSFITDILKTKEKIEYQKRKYDNMGKTNFEQKKMQD